MNDKQIVKTVLHVGTKTINFSSGTKVCNFKFICNYKVFNYKNYKYIKYGCVYVCTLKF